MVVLIVIVAAVLVLALVGWMLARMSPGRSRRIQEAAAADVAAMLEDTKLVSPDAPGNHEDDL
jgi:hypothetical protein